MKVKHLIDELKKCNPEDEVWTEGCDCFGKTSRIGFFGKGAIWIRRPADENEYDNCTVPEKLFEQK